jgi:hypothetical protein
MDIQEEIEKKIVDQVDQIIKEETITMKGRLPVKTGQLRDSIGVERNEMRWHVSSSVSYAKYVKKAEKAFNETKDRIDQRILNI